MSEFFMKLGWILIGTGAILSLLVTIPILILMFYRARRENPDAKPLSKDEWKILR